MKRRPLIFLTLSLLALGAGARALAQGTPAGAAPPAAAGGAAAATDPDLPDADLSKMFSDKAALGKESDQLAAQVPPLAAEETKLKAEQAALAKEEADTKRAHDAAAQVCNGHNFSLSAYQHCAVEDKEFLTKEKEITARASTYKTQRRDLSKKQRAVVDRHRAVAAQMAKIDAILARQKAFAAASDKCRAVMVGGTNEAVSQCMQTVWDGANNPNALSPITKPVPTRVTPNSK